MEALLEKNHSQDTLRNRYTFATTDEMKKALDELKLEHNVDVNEMLRRYAMRLITQAREKAS